MPEENKGLLISVGKAANKHVVQHTGPTIKVQGQAVSASAGRGIDIVFVIDTTGSMSDKIDGLLATCNRFVDELAKLKLSHRISVVAFGDLTVPGDDITVFKFTDDIQQVKHTLTTVPRYGGGANSGESSLEALEKALALPFRPNVVKALMLITDEPALQHQLSAREVTRRFIQKEVLTFVVSPPETYYQDLARQTGGVWYQVSASADFTGLIALFKNLASKLSSVVADVYRLGNGSVSKYLQLKAR
jgi:Mg-chelatase subunit ChlD